MFKQAKTQLSDAVVGSREMKVAAVAAEEFSSDGDNAAILAAKNLDFARQFGLLDFKNPEHRRHFVEGVERALGIEDSLASLCKKEQLAAKDSKPAKDEEKAA